MFTVILLIASISTWHKRLRAGRHAMILLGVNTDGNFLLQNWRKKKQFVECSKAYLEACGAKAVFVNDISHISSSLPRMDGVYAEAANVDHEDAYYPEARMEQ